MPVQELFNSKSQRSSESKLSTIKSRPNVYRKNEIPIKASKGESLSTNKKMIDSENERNSLLPIYCVTTYNKTLLDQSQLINEKT